MIGDLISGLIMCTALFSRFPQSYGTQAKDGQREGEELVKVYDNLDTVLFLHQNANILQVFSYSWF